MPVRTKAVALADGRSGLGKMQNENESRPRRKQSGAQRAKYVKFVFDWMTRSGRLLVVAWLLAVFAAGCAIASETSVSRLKFDIPAQPLAAALQTYSRISGVQVLYESGLEAGQVSMAVQGELTREAALKTLLGNIDLVVQYSRADAITLVSPQSASLDEPPDTAGGADLSLDTLHVPSTRPEPAVDRNELIEYINAIQYDVQSALQKSESTRGDSYRLGLELWVDSAKTIRRAHVFQSTGDMTRDNAISNRLEGLMLRRPAPPSARQPVRVMIIVRSM